MTLTSRNMGKWDTGVPSWAARGVGQMGLLADTNETFSARESVPLSYESGNPAGGCPSTSLRTNGDGSGLDCGFRHNDEWGCR